MKERQNDNYATECANLLAHVEYMRDFVSKRNEIYFPDWGEEIAPKNTDEMTFNFLDTHNESAEKCLKYLVAQYLLRLRPQMYVKYAKLLHKNLATLVNDLKDENKTDYKAAIEATYKELREILVIKKLESAEIEEKGEGINVPELVVFNPKYSKELLRENKEIQEQKKIIESKNAELESVRKENKQLQEKLQTHKEKLKELQSRLNNPMKFESEFDEDELGLDEFEGRTENDKVHDGWLNQLSFCLLALEKNPHGHDEELRSSIVATIVKHSELKKEMTTGDPEETGRDEYYRRLEQTIQGFQDQLGMKGAPVKAAQNDEKLIDELFPGVSPEEFKDELDETISPLDDAKQDISKEESIISNVEERNKVKKDREKLAKETDDKLNLEGLDDLVDDVPETLDGTYYEDEKHALEDSSEEESINYETIKEEAEQKQADILGLPTTTELEESFDRGVKNIEDHDHLDSDIDEALETFGLEDTSEEDSDQEKEKERRKEKIEGKKEEEEEEEKHVRPQRRQKLEKRGNQMPSIIGRRAILGDESYSDKSSEDLDFEEEKPESNKRKDAQRNAKKERARRNARRNAQANAERNRRRNAQRDEDEQRKPRRRVELLEDSGEEEEEIDRQQVRRNPQRNANAQQRLFNHARDKHSTAFYNQVIEVARNNQFEYRIADNADHPNNQELRFRSNEDQITFSGTENNWRIDGENMDAMVRLARGMVDRFPDTQIRIISRRAGENDAVAIQKDLEMLRALTDAGIKVNLNGLNYLQTSHAQAFNELQAVQETIRAPNVQNGELDPN